MLWMKAAVDDHVGENLYHLGFSERGQTVSVAVLDDSETASSKEQPFSVVDSSGVLPQEQAHLTFVGKMEPLDSSQTSKAKKRLILKYGRDNIDDSDMHQLRFSSVYGECFVSAVLKRGPWVHDEFLDNEIRSKTGKSRFVQFLKVYDGAAYAKLSGDGKDKRMKELAKGAVTEQAFLKLQAEYKVNQKYRLWQAMKLDGSNSDQAIVKWRSFRSCRQRGSSKVPVPRS